MYWYLLTIMLLYQFQNGLIFFTKKTDINRLKIYTWTPSPQIFYISTGYFLWCLNSKVVMKNNTISFTEDENCRSLNIEHQYNFVFEVYKEKADLVASKMSEE